jgi:hypothetical protein
VLSRNLWRVSPEIAASEAEERKPMAKESEVERKPKEHAEEKGSHREKARGEGEHKAKKKHLHQIVTTQAHDGTWSHDHIYKDHKEAQHSHPPVFAGTSSNMEDLHQHMDDHFGPQANEGEEQAEGGAGGAGEEQAEGEQGGGAQPA